MEWSSLIDQIVQAQFALSQSTLSTSWQQARGSGERKS